MKLLALLSLFAISLARKTRQTRLYYIRDNAGLSNVRLQFETLVATAAIFNKELMIPPPSTIDHMDEAFIETDVYSEKALREVINFQLRQGVDLVRDWCPPDSFHLVTTRIEEVDFRTIPLDKDWCFGQMETRISHFECLLGISNEQRTAATQAVFNGLQIRGDLLKEAGQILQSQKLHPGRYAAAHIRRADFSSFRPELFQSMKMEGGMGEVLNTYTHNVPLIVATDAAPGDAAFQDIVKHAKASRVLSTAQMTGAKPRTLKAALLDLILCAEAGTFIGTPDSTFSNSIHTLRRKMEICRQQPDPERRAAVSFLSVKQTVRRGQLKLQNLWFQEGQLSVVGRASASQLQMPQNPMMCWTKVAQFSELPPGAAKTCQMDDLL